MRLFSFIHAADIHLDSPLIMLERYEGAPIEELRQATRRALENLVGLAISEEVAFVLIAGDLYDGDWKDYNTGLYFTSQMTKLREAGILVFIISGNHDAANKITKALRPPETVRFFSTDKPETFHLDDLGVAIHGQGFARQAIYKDLSASYPSAMPGYFNIGMLHTCATGREGHESYAPCKIDGLLSTGYQYWALGHIHQQEVISEDPMIVFPGNIQGRHIREAGPKGCMLVTVDDSGLASADFRPLDVVRWLSCDIDASGTASGYDVVDRIYERLKDHLQQSDNIPLVVRIEVSGACRAHNELMADPERWRNEIRSAALDLGAGRIWIEKVNILTRLLSESEAGKLAEGPVGELVSLLDEIRSDPGRLQKLGESMDDLLKKLPREVKHPHDGRALEDSEWLARALEGVRPLLLGRLMSKGSGA
jgi:exonuclease SbcD